MLEGEETIERAKSLNRKENKVGKNRKKTEKKPQDNKSKASKMTPLESEKELEKWSESLDELVSLGEKYMETFDRTRSGLESIISRFLQQRKAQSKVSLPRNKKLTFQPPANSKEEESQLYNNEEANEEQREDIEEREEMEDTKQAEEEELGLKMIQALEGIKSKVLRNRMWKLATPVSLVNEFLEQVTRWHKEVLRDEEQRTKESATKGTELEVQVAEEDDKDPSDLIMLEDPQALQADKLLDMMEEHMANLNFIVRAVRAMKHALKVKNSFAKELQVDMRAQRVVLNVIKLYKLKNRTLCRTALSVLSSLANSLEAKLRMVDELQAVETTLELMKDMGDSGDLLLNAVALLASLGSAEENKLKMVSLGVPQAVLTAMHSSSSNDLQVFGCTVMWNLSYQHMANKASLREVGALSELMKIMSSEPKSLGLSIAVVGALESLSVDGKNEDLMVEMEVTKPLVRLMFQHQVSVAVQNHSLGLIFNLAFGGKHSEERAKRLIQDGVLNAVVSIVQLHMTDTTMLLNGLGCLQYLAIGPDTAKDVEAAGVRDLIETILDTLPNDESVTEHARGVLTAIEAAKSKPVRDAAKDERDKPPPNVLSVSSDESDAGQKKGGKGKRKSKGSGSGKDKGGKSDTARGKRKRMHTDDYGELDNLDEESTEDEMDPMWLSAAEKKKRAKLQESETVEEAETSASAARRREKDTCATLLCPKGHFLKKNKVKDWGLTCDSCDKSLDHTIWSFSCIDCDFDICEVCGVKYEEKDDDDKA